MYAELIATNPNLLQFLEQISSPYSSVEFARLGLPEDDEFLDAITGNIINFPVLLHGKSYDFNTLYLLDEDYVGAMADPFNREKFTFADVKPNVELLDKIRDVLAKEHAARRKIVSYICASSAKGKLDRVMKTFADNLHISCNDEYKNGFSALHYACQNKQLACAKFLLENGAELDKVAGETKIAPLAYLNAVDAEMLKQYLLDFLGVKIQVGDAISCIRYAKLLQNGIVLKIDLTKAAEFLEKAGDLGDVNGYLLCGDMYAALPNSNSGSLKLAAAFYQKAIVKHNSVIAKVQKTIIDLHSQRQEIVSVSLSAQEISALADNFNSGAMFLYALLFRTGVGVSRSSKKYNLYANMAAKNAHMHEQYQYADCIQSYDPVNAAKYYKMAADSGYIEAQLKFAVMCYFGQGIDKNLFKAAEYLKKAADKGEVVAQVTYALMCRNGEGVVENAVEAAEYYKMAADAGHIEAQFNYAMLLSADGDVGVDYPEAAKYFKLAADAGYIAAQLKFATLCVSGEGVAKNLAVAAEYFKKAAHGGDVSAQFYYAVMCESGEGVEKNLSAAVEYYKMAAHGGDLDAQFNYAVMCANGKGIDKNPEEAAEYYKIAADDGHLQAQFNYAIACYNGKGVDKNLAVAAAYYKMAANKGCVEAQFVYALMCAHGDGVATNTADADEYYRMAADNGHVTAQFNYAVMLNNGDGIEVNFFEAAKYFKLAAGAGDIAAQFNYAVMCERGEGVDKNLAVADEYYRMATDNGYVGKRHNSSRLKF